MVITVSEWERIYEDRVSAEEYLDLENYGKYHSKILECGMDGRRRYVQTKRFVGSVKCGETILDIVPKTGFYDHVTARERLLMILCELWEDDYPSEKVITSLKTDNCSILEWFISVFISNTKKVFRKGIARQYYSIEGNEPMLRGHLVFSEDIRKNYALRDRFYVEYDIFGPDIPENRILKATLKHLLRQTTSKKNRHDLRMLIDQIDYVGNLQDVNIEFSKCTGGREKDHYRNILRWCRLFLTGKGLTLEGGEEGTESYLFNMDRLFEEYVAKKLKENLPPEWSMFIQNSSESDYFCDRYLYTADNPGISLRPDVMFRKKSKDDGEDIVIFDTKWKDSENGNSIKESDHYQMFAYSYRYNTKSTVLVYPDELYEEFKSIDGRIRVYGRGFNLSKPVESARNLLNEFLV